MISKRFFARLMTLGVIIGLTACAAGGSRTSVGVAFKNGDYLGAFRALKADLASPGEARRRAVRQFSVSPEGPDGLVTAFQQAIHGVDGLGKYAQLTAEVTLADASGVLTREQTAN